MPLIARAGEGGGEEIETLVCEAIVERPAILLRTVGQLQHAEEAAQAISTHAALAANRGSLFNDPNAPVPGNSGGDVTVVEFFDCNGPLAVAPWPRFRV
ncbi:hypothetical protein [Sedimentitalea nanhaiensis]|uniref:Uncharacterized protein n=1 Tax=Sedimentitalea nanhaiensis TaxID=999627 RepID=A0A1I7DSJ2_9RHOB|nr:hypothetical protein [Sedimentitalea nanhaiensis]SFU14633.1 hypothetical protein SAMN05216236_13348 [Sedimentitalea nanhaiensis]